MRRFLTFSPMVTAFLFFAGPPTLAQEQDAGSEIEEAERNAAITLTREQCLAIEERDEKFACFAQLRLQREAEIERANQRSAEARQRLAETNAENERLQRQIDEAERRIDEAERQLEARILGNEETPE